MAGSFSGKPNPIANLQDSIRKRPGMYIGSIDPLGINNAIYEGIANSVDQYLKGFSTKVSLKVKDNFISISDDGPGLPFDKPAPEENYSSLADFYLMNFHDTPTADHHAPHIHIIGSGMGMALLNAVSKRLSIKSYNGIFLWCQEFEMGKKINDVEKIKSDLPSGCTLEFELDPVIFKGNKPDIFKLRKTMFELAHFYPGLIVEYQNERFVAPNGLLDLACIHYHDEAWPHVPQLKFFYEGIHDDVQVQVAAIGETKDYTEYRSWINGTITVDGGTHVKGLDSAFISSQWKPKLAFIHVVMHQPEFAGPSKDALINENIKLAIETILKKPIDEFRSGLA